MQCVNANILKEEGRVTQWVIEKRVIEIRTQQGNRFISNLIIFFAIESHSSCKYFTCRHAIITNIRSITSVIYKDNIFTFINFKGNQKYINILDLFLISLNNKLIGKNTFQLYFQAQQANFQDLWICSVSTSKASILYKRYIDLWYLFF